MTRPDNGDEQLPELSPDLWEPLSDDVFSRMLSEAMDSLAAPLDLSDVPDQAEDYPEDYVFDGAAEDFDDSDDADAEDAADSFDDLDDFNALADFRDPDDGVDPTEGQDDDDLDGGDVL